MRMTAAAFVIAFLLSACSPSPTRDPAQASALAAEIQRQMAENFGAPGDASWYPHITSVTVEGSTLVLGTDLTSRSEAASGVCSDGSNYVFANDADASLASLEVRGPSGQVLIRRGAVSDPC